MTMLETQRKGQTLNEKAKLGYPKLTKKKKRHAQIKFTIPTTKPTTTAP